MKVLKSIGPFEYITLIHKPSIDTFKVENSKDVIKNFRTQTCRIVLINVDVII